MLTDQTIIAIRKGTSASTTEPFADSLAFARAIESAATAPLLARIAELDRSLDVIAQNTEAQAHASLQREIELTEKVEKLTQELEEARKDEREHWENACRLMLVSRSGQITDMALAERLVGLISEDRKEKQAIRAAIKEQTK